MKKTDEIVETKDNKEIDNIVVSEATVDTEPSVVGKVESLEDEIFNIKFNYNRLIDFTRQLLTHEQHVEFAAKKKELFG